jgi:hypothetical protein
MPQENDDDDYADGYDEYGPTDDSNTDEYADGYDENGPIDDKSSNGGTESGYTSWRSAETTTATSGNSDSGGSEGEGSTENTLEMIKLYLNGLQAYTKEPALKSRMDEGVHSLKDQIISMSSSVKKFSKVKTFCINSNPLLSLRL